MNKEGTQIKSPVLYLQHHYELLKLEYEYEKEEFKRQTETMGVARKELVGKSNGACAGIRYRWDGAITMP